MTSTKPTKTTNKLPFTVLSHERFEDLCMLIIFRMKQWNKIQHFGRKGKDGGVDIWAEYGQTGSEQSWIIQSKRYQEISYNQIKKILDDAVAQNPTLPDKYILILACDVSRPTFDKFTEYCKKLGIKNSDIIGASTLEAMLYTGHQDALKTYFDIDVLEKRTKTITRIKRRLRIKKFVDRNINEFRGHEVIIRDVNRADVYPDFDDLEGISAWFKFELHTPYHRGISGFLWFVESVWYRNSDPTFRGVDEWVVSEKKPKGKGWKQIYAWRIGNIPFDNIVAIDMEGDEYYPQTHIYCEFSNGGQPYELIWYMPKEEYTGEVGYSLPPEKQVKAKSDINPKYVSRENLPKGNKR